MIHLLAPEEVTPELGGRLVMHDAESGAQAPVDVGPAARTAYSAELEKHLAEIEQFAARHSIRYVRALTQVPLEELILHYLRRGGVLA